MIDGVVWYSLLIMSLLVGMEKIKPVTLYPPDASFINCSLPASMEKHKQNQEPLLSSTNYIGFSYTRKSFYLRHPENTKRWLKKILLSEKKTLFKLRFVFCTDDYLLEINIAHLQHDYLTDIITFDLSENKVLESEIYISVDRVKENSKTHLSSFHVEIHRVMAHGILHLCGYGDKTLEEQIEMRKKEDKYLSLLNTFIT
jgi:rRNA maturation RNase YbeY